MIKIHFDFTDNTEVSYKEGLILKDNFNTCCLDSFCTDCKATDVIIIDKSGNYISRNELLLNKGNYTSKQIRNAHNILKMFKANTFNWQSK